MQLIKSSLFLSNRNENKKMLIIKNFVQYQAQSINMWFLNISYICNYIKNILMHNKINYSHAQ
jgi:hypothetical protein